MRKWRIRFYRSRYNQELLYTTDVVEDDQIKAIKIARQRNPYLPAHPIIEPAYIGDVEEKMKKVIWTLKKAGSFMTFGPRQLVPVGGEVEVTGPFPIGLGFSAYVATGPNGKTFVAEATTGAIVGNSLDQVKTDIITGDKTIMAGQVSQAQEQAKEITLLEADEFWHLLGAANG